MKADSRDSDLVALSTRCKPFTQLLPEVVQLVYERCEIRSFGPGEALMRQGDPGDSLMVLMDGRATVSATDEQGHQRSIASLEAFDVIGEMALLTDQRRSVDVITESTVRALVLEAGEFQSLALRHPEVGLVLTHLMADRLGEHSVDALGGKFIDRYRILHCVGRGAMAVVYEACEGDREDHVALKMMSHRLLYEPGAMSRFQREAEVLQELRHDNIARIDRRFSAYRTSFIAMEFCDGPVLSSMIKKHGAFPEAQVRRIVGQLASALCYMHGEGVIHRDLKPSNVMSTRDGTIKLTDFGLAKPTHAVPVDPITTVKAAMGTPQYMAPEQFSGEDAGMPSDVYALGCLTFELLTGKLPFHRRNFLELVEDKLHFCPPPSARDRRRHQRGDARAPHPFAVAGEGGSNRRPRPPRGMVGLHRRDAPELTVRSAPARSSAASSAAASPRSARAGPGATRPPRSSPAGRDG